MSRVAALYDIHGNLPALEAVLTELERDAPDTILVGGDVSLGPMPAEVLERLVGLGTRVRWIRGNTDRMLVDSARGEASSSPWGERIAWAARHLSAQQINFLAALPPLATIDIEGLGPTLFCHGTPRSDEEIVTRLTPADRMASVYAGIAEAVVVGGHTHIQMDREVADRRVVNAGSVGLPYEGVPGAYWAMLGPGVELRRTRYDVEHAAADVRATGFPNADELIERFLLHPDSAESASERFEALARGTG